MNILARVLIITALLLPLHVFSQITVNDSLIYKLNIKINKIDTGNVDKVIVNDISLDEVEVKLNEITYRVSTGKAKIDAKNKSIILFQLDILKNRVVKLRIIIDKQISALAELYYNKAITSLHDSSKNAEAKEYLDKSIVINPLYIPSLYQLAHIRYDEGNLIKSSELMLTILNKTYPVASNYDTIVRFGNRLYDSFIYKAEQLIQDEKYNEAEDLLTGAYRFCNNNKIINCRDNLRKTMTRTKYGMFVSYLNVAESAINTKHPEIAESFIFSALAYKRKNSEYLSRNRDAEDMLELVIDSYVNSAGRSIDKGNYTDAMKYFEKASVLCDSLGNESCNRKIKNCINSIRNNIYEEFIAKAEEYFKTGKSKFAEDFINKAKSYKNENLKEIKDTSQAENLIKQIKFVQYRKLINEAEFYYKEGYYEYAMKNLDGAEELEAKYKLDKYVLEDSLRMKVAKPLIHKIIESANIKIWANSIDEVQDIFNVSLKMQEKNHLKNDSEVTKWINILNNKLQKKICENAQNDYDVLMFKASSSVIIKDFILAEQQYDNAINLANKNISCKLNATIAISNKSKYVPPANYQKLIFDSRYLYNAGNYSKFLTEYNAAESYFSLFKISDYGFKHIPLYEYIIQKDELKLLYAGVQFYTDNSDFEKALNLLKYLKGKNYSSGLSRDLQEKLAVSLAKYDRSSKKKTTTKANISAYTSNSKWFRYFNKKYKYELKK